MAGGRERRHKAWNSTGAAEHATCLPMHFAYRLVLWRNYQNCWHLILLMPSLLAGGCRRWMFKRDDIAPLLTTTAWRNVALQTTAYGRKGRDAQFNSSRTAADSRTLTCRFLTAPSATLAGRRPGATPLWCIAASPRLTAPPPPHHQRA